MKQLGERAVSVAEELRDDIRCLLATRLGEPLKAFRILTLDADEDNYRGLGVAVMTFDVTGVELRQIGVEVAWLGIGVCPGVTAHRLSCRILRSASVELQPVTTS